MNPMGIAQLALNLEGTIAGLSTHRIRGPIQVTKDGEPIAVIIRAEAWAPRLQHYRFTPDGPITCALCPGEPVIYSRMDDLGDALKIINEHWRTTHRKTRP